LAINITGLAKQLWPEKDNFYSNSFRMLCSEGVKGQKGLAIVLDNTVARLLTRR